MILTILLAILPTVILGYLIYKKDIIEKEPISLLAKLFFVGVILTVPAAFLERFLISVIEMHIEDTLLIAFMLAFFCIALIEEGYKFLFSYLIGYKNKNFNHIYDCIVYCVFLSLGFATLENILYVVEYGKSTAIIRAKKICLPRWWRTTTAIFWTGSARPRKNLPICRMPASRNCWGISPAHACLICSTTPMTTWKTASCYCAAQKAPGLPAWWMRWCRLKPMLPTTTFRFWRS